MLNWVQLCSHLGQSAGPPDAILEKHHSMTIFSKFGSNWATGSRQEDFYVNFPKTIPPKFGCNWPSGFWGEDFYVNFP
jgi:hypothetical protein